MPMNLFNNFTSKRGMRLSLSEICEHYLKGLNNFKNVISIKLNYPKPRPHLALFLTIDLLFLLDNNISVR